MIVTLTRDVFLGAAGAYCANKLFGPSLERIGHRLAEWGFPSDRHATFRPARLVGWLCVHLAVRGSSAERGAEAVLGEIDVLRRNRGSSTADPLAMALSLVAPALSSRVVAIAGKSANLIGAFVVVVVMAIATAIFGVVVDYWKLELRPAKTSFRIVVSIAMATVLGLAALGGLLASTDHFAAAIPILVLFAPPAAMIVAIGLPESCFLWVALRFSRRLELISSESETMPRGPAGSSPVR